MPIGFEAVTDRVGGVGGTLWNAARVTDILDSLDSRGVSVTDPVYDADPTGSSYAHAEIQGAVDDVADAGGGDVLVPPGTYKLGTWIEGRSNVRIIGAGPTSILSNDKTNATVDKHACILPGLHHPALMSGQTSYVLDAVSAGAYEVTTDTAGDAANFAAGDLVIVGSATESSGVSRHAQLNKVVSATAGTGVVVLVDPIAVAISDPEIWTITGTDGSTSTDIYAVENFAVENLAFKGRAAIATKGAVFGGQFRNLTMLDTHLFFGTNMLTNVLIENLSGQYSGRYLEFAFNSYNVTARNWKGRFRSLSALQTGESQVFPIHLGEQPYRILLDDVFCHLDSRYTQNTELAQIKGSRLRMRLCDWRHAGSSGSYAVSIPDCAYTGFNYDDIVFEDCTLNAASKARIVQVGGASVAAENPTNVHFRRGELTGTPSGESLWFQSGKNLSCSMTDRSGKRIKVSTPAQYPALNGYVQVV